MKKTVAIIGVFLMVSLCGIAVSIADENKDTTNWEFNLAPFYLWGVTIDGDVTIGTQTVPVEIPFDDVVDNLDAAFILHFEAMHKSNWGFLFDIDYLDVSNDITMPGPLKQNAKVDFDAMFAELSGLYRIAEGNHRVDLIAGFRYTGMENKVNLEIGPDVDDISEDWVDPLVGFRWIWGFAQKWSLVTRADIGGLGVGSDLAAQGLALFDWQTFKYVSFLAGYRALYQDYENGSNENYFNYDATVHGPLLGLIFRW